MDAEFVPMSSIPEDGVLDTAMKNLSIKIPRERTENDLPRASMRRLTSSSPNNRLRTRSPATRPGLLNSLKRSMSRDSRHSSMQSSTSKLSRLGEANQEFSHLTPTRIGMIVIHKCTCEKYHSNDYYENNDKNVYKSILIRYESKARGSDS